VQFHVDSDEDQLLLRAAGHFGSQQKALIAALHALNEVLALRRQVETLEQECERQRRLLAEAQALFRSS
jgi:cell division protein ZapA (FtsZ GTPase activity inhibitor)